MPHPTLEQRYNDLLAQQAVQNELFQQAERVAAIGSWSWNLDSGERTYSDNLYRIYRLKPGADRQAFVDTVHPDDRARVNEAYERVLRNNEAVNLEVRILMPDGGVRHMQVRSQFSVTRRNERWLIGTTQDITDQKQSEHAAIQSKDMLQRIMDAPNVGLAVYKAVRNEQGKIIDFIHEFINRRTLQALGNDMTGRLLSEHGDDGASQIQDFIKAIETQTPNSYVKHSHFAGAEHWVLLSNAPLDNDRLVHTWEDITEVKRNELELVKLKDEMAQRAEDKYRSIFENIDEGFAVLELVLDESGNAADLIYRETNEAFEQHSGLKNVVGKKTSELAPRLEQHWLDSLNQVYKTGEPVRTEGYQADLNRWFTLQYLRVGGPGSKLVATVFQDITERKQREQQQTFLLKFSDALRTETSADAIANRALRMLSDELRLDCCYVGVYRLAEDRGEFPYQYGNGRIAPMPDGGVRLSDFPEGLRVTSDRTLAIDDAAVAEGLTDIDRQSFRALGLRAFVAASLRKGERHPIWAIVAVSASPRRWTQSEIALVEEITERTWSAMEQARTDVALRKSEDQYHTLFDSIDEGVSTLEIIFDENDRAFDFRFLDSNAAMTKMTGLSSAIHGKTALEVLPHIDAIWLETYERVVKTGEPIRFQYDLEDLGNNWFDVHASRVGGSDSRKVVAVYSNITERKRAELNLAFLAEVSVELGGLTNIAETMSVLGEKIGLHFNASLCVFSVIDAAAGTFTSPHVWYRTGAVSVAGAATHIADYYTDEYEQASRAGETWVVRDGATDKRAKVAEMAAIGIAAVIHVPLLRNGVWRYSLSITDAVPRDWRDDEIELMRELTTRIWTRLERARAEEALHELNQTLELKVAQRTAELRESKELLQTVFDQSPNSISVKKILYDANGAVEDFELLMINAFGERLAGKPRASLVGKRYSHEFPHSIASGVLDEYKRAAETGAPTEFERWYVGEGMRHWFRFNVMKYDGLLVTTVEDITKRKQAALALAEEHRRMMDAQTLGHIGSFEWNVGDENVKWSDEMYRLNGIEPQSEPITNATVESLIHPDDRRAELEIKETSLRQAGMYVIKHRIVRRDGAVRWVSHRFESLADDNNKVYRVHGTVQDITEQQAAEEEIKKNLTLLRQTEAIAQTGSWEFDPVTGEFHWSPGMYRFFNLEPGTPVQPETYVDFALPGHEDTARRIANKLREAKEPFVEMLKVRHNGSYRALRVIGQPVQVEEGRPPKVLGVDVDITAQEQAEQTIRENLHFIQRITHASPEIIFVLDLGTRELLYTNGTYAEALEFTPAAIAEMSNPIFDILHPDDLPHAMRHLEEMKTCADHEVRETEYRVMGPGGDVHWFRDRNTVFKRDAAGVPVQKLGFSHEVTEEKKSAERLMQSERELSKRTRFLETVLDASNDVITAYDTDRRLTVWNKKAESRYNLPRESVVGKSLRELFPQLYELYSNALDRAFQNELVYMPGVKNDEPGVFADVTLLPLHDEQGLVTGVLNIDRDTSETYHLQGLIAERDALLETVFDYSSNGIVVLDNDGVVRAWNKRCEALRDLRREEAIGNPLFDVVPAFKQFPLPHVVDYGLQGRGAHLPAQRLFGSGFFDLFLAPLKTADGSPNGALVIMNDVTARVEAERQLAQTSDALRITQKQLAGRNGDMVSIAFAATRDLRHPLHKIQSFINLLHARESGNLTERGSDYLVRMRGAAAQLDRLFDDLIAYIRVGSETHALAPTDMNEVLEEVQKQLRKQIQNANAVVNADKLPVVNAVRHQMQEVLLQLVKNALQFRKPDESPRVQITWEAVHGSHVNVEELSNLRNYIAITVSDNGIGFDPQIVKELFSLFRRHNSESTSTGLGLALCKRIAEEHDGALMARSKPGQGTAVTLYLPM